MNKEENNQGKPSKKELQAMHDFFCSENYEEMSKISEIITPEYVDFYMQGGYQDLNIQPQVIPKSDNQWILKKEWDYDYILTMEKFAGRMKITMEENTEYSINANTYSCSWTYNEIVAKNQFFKNFEDIDTIINLLKTVIENPNKFSFELYSSSMDEDQKNYCINLKFDLFKNGSILNLTLLYLEKDSTEKAKELKEYEEFITSKCSELEDDMFDLSLKMNQLLAENGLKGKNIFPDEVKKRCEDRWKSKHPQEKLNDYPLDPYDEEPFDLETIGLFKTGGNLIVDQVGGH